MSLFCLCHSATWPPEVRRLAGSYLKNPFQVYVGSLDLQVCVQLTIALRLSVYHVGSSTPPLIPKYLHVTVCFDYFHIGLYSRGADH